MLTSIRRRESPSAAPQRRLYWVAQYFRWSGLLTGFGVMVVTIVALVTPLPLLHSVRDRPWMLALAAGSAVSAYVLGERLLRRERLAAVVAFALLVTPLLAAAVGRSVRPWTVVVSTVVAFALASAWRSLR